MARKADIRAENAIGIAPACAAAVGPRHAADQGGTKAQMELAELNKRLPK